MSVRDQILCKHELNKYGGFSITRSPSFMHSLSMRWYWTNNVMCSVSVPFFGIASCFLLLVSSKTTILRKCELKKVMPNHACVWLHEHEYRSWFLSCVVFLVFLFICILLLFIHRRPLMSIPLHVCNVHVSSLIWWLYLRLGLVLMSYTTIVDIFKWGSRCIFSTVSEVFSLLTLELVAR